MILGAPSPGLVRNGGSANNLFLSHSWDTDRRGRCTHDRVRELKGALARFGWKLWFDEEKLLLGTNIDSEMASGIKNADAVCICVTRSYIEKINAQNNNCAKEWNFAQAINKRILPLIFEEEMLDIRNWPAGVATMYMSNTFYIDCSGDDLILTAEKLSKMLALLGLKPRLASTWSWPLARRVPPVSSAKMPRTRSFIKI